MRVLICLHRWLGVAFCLLFAMWFASGIVMHFVPFPAFTEAARFAGLVAIDLAAVKHEPAAALASSGITDATRIRLIERGDGPVYLVPGSTRTAALHAGDLSDAAVHSQRLALAIATDYAAHRQWDAAAAEVFGPAAYDQWTVPNAFDRYRPLYRIALNDDPGTELYVASTTGEVVLDTTHRERAWNYVGSIAHWIYPTALRRHPAAWSRLLWWLSFLALIGASAGAAIGVLRLGADGWRLSSPYRGWQAWHHWLGLCCMLFVLTWMFSGWLSIDNGALFSTGKPTGSEIAAATGAPDWNALPRDESQHLDPQTVEAEWFAFNGRIYRRERGALGSQHLVVAGAEESAAPPDRAFLRRDEIDTAMGHLARSCAASRLVGRDDDYAVASTAPDAPVFRAVCGDDWFAVDASNGALLEKLDSSRRAYRWLYGALHTFDFPVLTARPSLRTAFIVALCGCGFIFSLTGVVIAWRRLLACFRAPEGR
jgi:hypothetical protein